MLLFINIMQAQICSTLVSILSQMLTTLGEITIAEKRTIIDVCIVEVQRLK